MGLRVYRRKRKFTQTPEPEGKVKKSGRGNLRFVVQMHYASRPHFDLRLEFEGVFKSWAVPKTPSLNPQDQRLAVFVEDHPLEYGSFEGIIPKNNYGAGTVMIWDEGTYVERGSMGRRDSEIAMRRGFDRGHITFLLNGHKLKGEFALIQLKKDGTKHWLLVKKRDKFSTYKLTDTLDSLSVKTGRTIQEIADQAEKAGHVWLPKQQKQSPKSDPMPRRIKPMIASQQRHAHPHEQWLFEAQPQGLRAIAEVEPRRVSLYSRSGISFEKKFPEIVAELKALKTQLVLDGEVIQEKKRNHYRVRDLLFANGRDLRKVPLKERKAILQRVLKPGKNLSLTKTFSVSKKQPLPKGEWLALNPESFYHSGTSTDWQVIEHDGGKALTKKSLTLLSEPRLTHLEKVYFPTDGITKGDVIDYYRQIAPLILPYLKDRPESLNRHPNGIHATGFYQKDMTGHIPRWLKTTRIFSESTRKSIDYVMVQDEQSLLYIANLGCIEIHPWFSRVPKIDFPDFLVIDLDPDGNSFDHVIQIAHEFREILEAIGAPHFCKTSGATGLHIGVPTGALHDFETVRAFAESLCKVVAKKFPSTTSIDRNPNRRKRKIYLDFMQNRRGQTLAAPYCLRPRDGAPVSMPLPWRDLRPGLRPQDFHIGNAIELLRKRRGDPWKGVLGPALDLAKCVRAFQKIYKLT